MSENTSQTPEDLGAPQSYLVLREGTPVYDRSGASAGDVWHVVADEGQDIFHGLILKGPHARKFVRSDLVDGIYQHGVIISVPAAELPEPSADSAAAASGDSTLAEGLRRAWDWLIEPK